MTAETSLARYTLSGNATAWLADEHGPDADRLDIVTPNEASGIINDAIGNGVITGGARGDFRQLHRRRRRRPRRVEDLHRPATAGLLAGLPDAPRHGGWHRDTRHLPPAAAAGGGHRQQHRRRLRRPWPGRLVRGPMMNTTRLAGHPAPDGLRRAFAEACTASTRAETGK